MKVLVKEGWVNQDTGKKWTKDTVYISSIFTGRVGWFCKL
jgi:hypothetical protein